MTNAPSDPTNPPAPKVAEWKVGITGLQLSEDRPSEEPLLEDDEAEEAGVLNQPFSWSWQISKKSFVDVKSWKDPCEKARL